MGIIVTFNYANWLAIFPEFTTTVSEPQSVNLLTMAESYNRNDGGGPVIDAPTQLTLLNLMVAHLAQMLYGSSLTNNQASPLVGRISTASEGSVSVETDMTGTINNAWYNQTKYGAMWWALTAPYRTMRVIPGPQRYFGFRPSGVWSRSGGGGFGGF